MTAMQHHGNRKEKTKMEIIKINSMECGNSYETPLLITDITEKVGRNGSSYLDVKLSDGENKITAKWFDKTANTLGRNVGDICIVRLGVDEYQGQPSYKIIGCKDCNEEIDKSQFLITAPVSAEEMYQYIFIMLQNLENKEISAIGCAMYEEYKEKLLRWSAAKTMHHAFYSGLLYHTYRMVQSASELTKIYPCNKDLVICGCAIHDIGKLIELDTNELGEASYTVDGTLFNHLLIGCELVTFFGKKVGASKEVIKNLKHIVASHHENLEFGAIVKPATTEAMLVSQIDYLDSKVEAIEEATKDLEAGCVTDTCINGTHLYKPNL